MVGDSCEPDSVGLVIVRSLSEAIGPRSAAAPPVAG